MDRIGVDLVVVKAIPTYPRQKSQLHRRVIQFCLFWYSKKARHCVLKSWQQDRYGQEETR